MKKLKSFSGVAIFFLALAFTSCNQNPKDNNSNTIDKSDSTRLNNKKDTGVTTNDTLKNPGVEAGAVNNNPDITK